MKLRELAVSIRSGATGAVEVIRERQALAEQHTALNALTDTDWEAALAAAAVVDRRRAAGDRLGPLAGVPVTVKDVIAVAGFGLTAGSRAFAGHTAASTAPAVQQLIDAGAIVVGKTNCPEFAFNMTCENELFGRTGNPIAADRSPGGSSGGEAAAVAAGISALGVGTDFGGSVRWPAQCTGIVALRPTVGRVSGDGQVPGLGGSMAGPDDWAWANPATLQGQSQVIGPMARSVDDLALALEVMQTPASGARAPGSHPHPDRTGWPGPGAATFPAGPVPPGRGSGAAAGGSSPASSGRIDGSVAGLRIGWSDGRHIGPVRSEVRAAIATAAAGLGAAGAQAQELGQVFDGCLEAYNRLRAADAMHDHARSVRGREHLVAASALSTFESSFTAGPEALADAWRDALAARARALAVFDEVDVLLLPVAGGPACLPDGSLTVDSLTLRGWDVMVHLRAVTLTGAPVVSVPVGISAEGLPLSVQVVAAPWREDLALRVAAALER